MEELVEFAAIRGTAKTLWRWEKFGEFTVTFSTSKGAKSKHELSVFSGGRALWKWEKLCSTFTVTCFRYQSESKDFADELEAAFRSTEEHLRESFDGDFRVVVTDAANKLVYSISYQLSWTLAFGRGFGSIHHFHKGLGAFMEGRWSSGILLM